MSICRNCSQEYICDDELTDCPKCSEETNIIKSVLSELQIDRLKDVDAHIYREFQRIWGLLPWTEGRTVIMSHLMAASREIQKILEEQK